MRKQMIIIFCVVFLGACMSPPQSPTPRPTSIPTATPSPTSTPTEIPTPTNTPIPVYSLSGIVFFDYDGNGEQDLEHGVDAEELEQEPAIAGVQICLDTRAEEKACVQIDENGLYAFDGVQRGRHWLLVEIPIDDPATAFRYINILHGWVDIPAYEMDGFQVPSQHLADTEFLSIDSPITIDLEEDSFYDVALMQGWLSIKANYPIYSHFDLDDRSGSARDYQGRTVLALFPRYRPGTFDQHTGIDLECNSGDPVYAYARGRVILAGVVNDAGALAIEILHDNGFTTHYGHLSASLVNNGETVYRSQLIGLCGRSGTQWDHIHFQLGDNSGNAVDPFQDIASEDSASDNHWVVHNSP